MFNNHTEFEYYILDQSNPNSIKSDDITSMYEDSKNRLWIGTRTGLNIFDRDSNKFKEFSMKDGLPNDVIYGILEDSEKNIWVSTNNGISRIQVIKKNNEPAIEVKNFEKEDGLLNNQFNRWSYYKARDGMLMFGGIDGLNYIYPEKIKSNSVIPPVVITSFSIFNKPVRPGEVNSPLSKHISETKQITLSYSDYVIAFEYSALNYTNTHNNRYAYKLEGFDKEWNYVGKERKATYTNLNPGEYVFKVIASNNDGFWNMEGTSIQLIIKPPFYKTTWFILIIILSLTGTIYGFYRYRTGILKIRANDLERIVETKTSDLISTNKSLQDQIIERERIEEALQQNKEKYRYLIENINEVIFSTDSDDAINYISPAVSSVLEYNWEEMINNPLNLYIYREDVQRFNNRKEKLLGNKSFSGEYRLISKSDQLIWMKISEKMIIQDKSFAGTRGVLTDIAERKLLESQLIQAQKLESIGQLAAGIAHEINTPTQYVGDNISFLKNAFSAIKELNALHQKLIESVQNKEDCSRIIDEIFQTRESLDIEFLCNEVPESIDQAVEGVDRITTIVRAMKGFSHPGTENKVAMNINELVESTLIVSKNVWKYIADVKTEYSQDLPYVLCLPAQFNQVILNIIVNATHAIEEKFISETEKKGLIIIKTYMHNNSIFITISDNGSGISEEIKNKVFNPFFTTKQVGKGTGQGLSIAHDSIVNKHSGTIDFNSVTGEGTTFIISIPVNAD
jgi:PAS domain S-box-containing protein